MNTKPLDLFPTRVWTFDAAHLLPQHDQWVHALEAKRLVDQNAKGRSTRNGWSGPKTLFQDPMFEALRTTVHEVVRKAFAEMGVASGLGYRLEAWGNIHDKGGFNQAHTHREALISGCYYLQVPPGGGALLFKDPRPGTLHSRALGQGVNSWHNAVMKPRAGTLLLFPQWLEHSVEPNEADESRLAIAFNAVASSGAPSSASA
jgi:uncharacterized protein (TIGR02466 family)